MNEKYMGKGYLNQFLLACKYSRQGLVYVYKSEASFRRNVFFLGISIVLTLYFEPGFLYGWALNAPFIIALAFECINTAIEAIIDQMEVENELVGAAKDCGSAAVAIMLVLGLVMWVHYMYLVYA